MILFERYVTRKAALRRDPKQDRRSSCLRRLSNRGTFKHLPREFYLAQHCPIVLSHWMRSARHLTFQADLSWPACLLYFFHLRMSQYFSTPLDINLAWLKRQARTRRSTESIPIWTGCRCLLASVSTSSRSIILLSS